jgi:circadian clock protein KaiC
MPRCADQQISLMMSQEIPALYGISQLSEDGISHLSDNVIPLQFVPQATQPARAVTVLKTRASRHDPAIREFTITPEGIVLDEPQRGATG